MAKSADTSQDGIQEIRVPAEAASIREALAIARKGGIRSLTVRLEAGFEEPAEAWPLELEVPSCEECTKNCLHCIEVVGPPERAAVVRDVVLQAPGPVDDGAGARRVTLQGVVVRGHVSLSGQGCNLFDCEVRSGIEIDAQGAGSIRSCSVGGRLGIAAHGAALVEDTEIANCNIAVCLYDNPSVTLQRNRFSHCVAAAIVSHCSISKEVGSILQLAPVIDESNTMQDCTNSFELHIEIDGGRRLVLDEWSLSKGVHDVPQARGTGNFGQIEILNERTLQILCRDAQEPRHRKAKKQKRCDKEKEKVVSTVGPIWAREALGILDDCTVLNLKQLRRAYRCKAREVHPDKQVKLEPDDEAVVGDDAKVVEQDHTLHGSNCEESSATKFHELTNAYETILATLVKDEPLQGGGRKLRQRRH